MTSTIPQTLRQADLESLAAVLNEQHARATDVVLSAPWIRFSGTSLELSDIEPVVSDEGVTNVNGLYVPTNVALEGLTAKLSTNPGTIPLGYLRQCRDQEPALFDNTLNSWLKNPANAKSKFLLRLFRSDDSLTGVLRAVLSDSYRSIDNLDVLLAALDGMQQAGLNADDTVIEADLTERRMIVRVTAPQIAVLADSLLENYRNPFDGSDVGRGWTPDRVRRISEREGEQMDPRTVFAGFVITNSEVGNGMFRVFPQLVIQVCGNGLSLVAEGTARRHTGVELEEGIQWAEDTQKANLDLIVKKTRDSVSSFLDPAFLTAQVEKLEEVAGSEITQPEPVIAAVSKKLGFTEDQRGRLLAHFIRGGQSTAGGIMQAVTSVAQVERDGDVAYEMELAAVKAMELAVAANKEAEKGLLVGSKAWAAPVKA